jgi:sensor histidine kinase YesM
MAPRIVLFFLFVFTCLVQRAAASDTLVINKISDLDSIPLLRHAAFFEDPTGDLSWQEAMQQSFTPAKKNMFRYCDSLYGKRRVTLWFRITVRNAMEDSARILLLFQTYQLYKEVVVLSHDDTLYKRPNYFFSPTRKSNRIYVIVPAAPGEQITYLIHIKNPYENLGPMTIMSVERHDESSVRVYSRKSVNYIGHIMFITVITFIILHTLAQYWMRRRREFLWYALYSTSLLLIGLDDLERQHYYDILFSFFPYIQNSITYPLFLISSLLYLRFARAYVDFKSLAPWFYHVVIWSERLTLVTLAITIALEDAFNNVRLARDIYTWWRIVLFITSFACVYLMLRSRKKVLYFFGIGTLLLTIGVMCSMFFYYYPSYNPFGYMVNMLPVEIGVVLELLCFTIGLSYKSHLIEVDKHQTQRQLIGQLEENHRLQEELNVKLESRAKELTDQVMVQQRELEKEKEQQLTLEFTRKITEMELQLLKSQLNPHFYFNTLNNLYGLAMIAPKKAPDAILKLSDIMEYVIYDCRNDKVPLGKELKFLQSYIELEKLRYDDNVRISINVSGKPESKSISPMLLIQFVENAFKHGIEKEKTNSFLRISINVANGALEYESANSINGRTGINGGIGLTNVRKRLDLLYPQKHDLQVIPGDHEFRVKLKITL